MERVLISDLMEQRNELYHYGVLNMHWGIRRYQPYSLIPRKSGKGGKEIGAAKSASKDSRLKTTVSKLRSKKNKTDITTDTLKGKSRKQIQEEAKSRKISEEKTARQRKEAAANIVKSGDAKLIYANRADLTDKQLQDAINRIGTEKTLKALVAEQNPSKMQKLANTVEKVKPLVETAETGIKTYNQVARVANAFLGENENGKRNNVLPYIGEAKNSYKQNDGMTDANRKLITSATTVSELMKGKYNAAESKAAQEKAANLNKLAGELQKENKRIDDLRKHEEANAREASEKSAAEKEAAAKARVDYLSRSIDTLPEYREKADVFKPSLNATNEYRFEKYVDDDPWNKQKSEERQKKKKK